MRQHDPIGTVMSYCQRRGLLGHTSVALVLFPRSRGSNHLDGCPLTYEVGQHLHVARIT